MCFPAIKKSFIFALCATLLLTTTPPSLRSEVLPPNEKALLLSNLAVPEDLGKVAERFTGKNSRMIIQIQDVHAHAPAQQNIAAMLERLRTVFGVEKVALEGAWTATSLPQSHALPTSREKQLLAGTLLEDDRISGPVYAAIMSPKPITLIGIEDETSYEKNRSLFLAHLDQEALIEEKLLAYGTALKSLQRSTWGAELLAFGTACENFKETSSLGNFLPVLLKTAEAHNVDASDLAQIILLQNIMTLEKSFVKERLKKEVAQVIKKYKNTPWNLEELLRGGKIPSEGIGLYPEIKKLTQLFKMRDSLSPQELMEQIRTLTGRILGALVKTPEERALWEKTERFYLSKRLLFLQATPSDLKDYENSKSFIDPEVAGIGLSDALLLSVDFYDTVKKRDAIFFNRIMNDPALAGDIAVVTGGFHTDGLSQRFRDAGISYITVTPELGDTPINEKIYNERMKETRGTNDRPVNEQTLSELRDAIAWIDTRFVEALKILFLTKDVRKALNVFDGKTVTVSNAERVSGLRAQGQLRRSAGPDVADFASFRTSEFLTLPRAEQIRALGELIQAAKEFRHKSMLISSVSVLQPMLATANAETRIKEIGARGDLLVLLQDVPSSEISPALLTPGVRKFFAKDMAALLQTPSLENLARQRPSVIMKNGFRSGNRVVVDEDPVWLELFPVLTLNARLYESARDPEFLALMKSLWVDVLSQELSQRAA